MLDTFSMTGLDDPVAASFRTSWFRFATCDGEARVLPADIGHFAYPGEGAADDFTRLARREGRQLILLAERERVLSRGIRLVSQLRGVQMIRDPKPLEEQSPLRIDVLSKGDRAQMLELARRTEPGPFEIDTPRLGSFIGVKDGGRLIAMAGLRMGFPGWSEISGVCVDPDYRGQGLARNLVTRLVADLERKGVQPFLHTYADNAGAIDLYRRLGFRIRAEMSISLVEARR